MTRKTDLKFALLLLVILGGIFLVVRKTIDSAHMNPGLLNSKLHRNMTRAEIGKLLNADLPTMWGAGSDLEAHFFFPDKTGYLFVFDVNDRLQEVYVDGTLPSGRRTRNLLVLPE